MIFTDEAVVVRREDWRERDKRITFFTRDHGVVCGVAVGAQKMTSKLSGHLEPLRLVEVMLARGKNGYTVAQVETKKNFCFGVGAAFGAAAEVVGVLGLYARVAVKLVEPEISDPVMFGLLVSACEAASQGGSSPSEVGQFLYMMARHSGTAPVFDVCVVCGQKKDFTWFSAELGGVVCSACPRPVGGVGYDPGREEQLFDVMMGFLKWRHLC